MSACSEVISSYQSKHSFYNGSHRGMNYFYLYIPCTMYIVQSCEAGHPVVHTTEAPAEQGLGHIIGRRQETGTCYKCCSSTGTTKVPCNNQLCKVPSKRICFLMDVFLLVFHCELKSTYREGRFCQQETVKVALFSGVLHLYKEPKINSLIL